MLPRKLRTQKIQEKVINPQGTARWQAGQVSRGILNTAIKWMEEKDSVTIDRLDILLLTLCFEHLHESAPIIGWNPFQSLAIGLTEITISTKELQRLLNF